ncbi:MAG: DNA mismatch repair protein MutS [Acidobacteria bacterium]|nr:DNA mismatch repair protein MutS [Acidobacteriota bacterium]MBI3423610.1 DNA mismatch repair protein MutS [Acidobacteriota bacterium]
MNSETPPAFITDPLAEYTNRLAARRARVAAEEARSQTLWKWRRIVFVIGLATLAIGFAGWLSAWWLALPVVVFIALMVKHQQMREAKAEAERAVQFYEYCLSRLDEQQLSWAGRGNLGARFANPQHPYAEDLDLFGQGSLFELLCTARTRAGEERLAGWLLAPTSIPEINQRQQAVDELRAKLDLREDLALLGEEMRTGIHHTELAAWGNGTPTFTSRGIQLCALLLSLFALPAVALWFVYGWGQLAFAALLLLTLFLLRVRADVAHAISAVERPSRDLKLLVQLLARFEQERFVSPRLKQLRAELEAEGLSPSQQIARLHRLCERLDWTRNQLVAPLAFVLLIPVHIALGIERWRARYGRQIARWLDALAELEALNSLAGYAYEHPDDPFPELVEGVCCYEGTQLGHPLIPAARCVRNDVRLDAQNQLLIISGSNMSGKSTLMRTVGVNVVLALAGAPVRAKRLRLARLNVGASIHILDSLQAGASRFYAEITRLRQIVELTRHELPLLFLLDEILSGTNSHDRAIGASAVVKGLVARGALGLVTTHDLALTRMEADLNGRARNVHFQDELKDGQMYFDYHMHAGVVERSNALELMRAIGLEV